MTNPYHLSSLILFSIALFHCRFVKDLSLQITSETRTFLTRGHQKHTHNRSSGSRRLSSRLYLESFTLEYGIHSRASKYLKKMFRAFGAL